MSTQTEQSAAIGRELIAHLRPGDAAPDGCEIARILGQYEARIGTGTNMQTWYVVALRSCS